MRLALVTGGHARVGAAIAAALARDGYTLALHKHHDIAPDPALLAALGEWDSFAVDLGDPAAVARFVPAIVARFGTAPTLLVNCASRFCDDDAGDATDESIAGHHQVNAAAPVALTLALARAGGQGNVVHILDQRVRNPVPDQLSYTLSKLALASTTRALAVALAPRWRINAVAPGLTLPSPNFASGQMERIAELMPLGCLPVPEDIANAVLFLAGASAVTGQTLFVDGGASLKAFDRDFAYL